MKAKDPNKKRGYWGFFAHTFALILVAVIVVGLVACWGFYQYDTGSERDAAADRINRLRDWLLDPENVDATDAEIRTQLSLKTATDNTWIDRGVVLYDMKTRKTYDSRHMLWSLVKIRPESTEYLDALQKACGGREDMNTYNESGAFVHYCISDDTTILDRYHEYEKAHPLYDCMIWVNDLYIKGDHVIPGSGELQACLGDETKAVFPLDPPAEIPEGYVHFVKKTAETHPSDALLADAIFLVSVGSGKGSPALAQAQENMTAYREKGTFNYGQSSDPAPTLWKSLTQAEVHCLCEVIPDADGPRWKLCTVTYMNFLQMHQIHFLTIGSGPFILLLLFALLIAKIRHMRYCKEYELNAYRRNLTASLAHDLKSPLMAISGYAENLRDNVHTEKRAAYADSILQNTQYMDRLIADVLDLAKLEQGTVLQKRSCDMAALVNETAAQFRAQTEEKHLTVTVSGTCAVSADPRMMTQALANLIGNAVKYTPEGGQIRVCCTEKTLSVSNDIAAPIPDAAKLIQPFAKGDDTRGSRSGSGMGLAIVKQICVLHGFRLKLTSEKQIFTAEIRF